MPRCRCAQTGRMAAAFDGRFLARVDTRASEAVAAKRLLGQAP